jgi:hypothetical protein
MQPREVVQAYLDAVEARDFECARRYLADVHFHYRSPISGFDNADAFIADVSRIGAILEKIVRRKTFVEGDEVCSILDFVTRLSGPETTAVVQVARVEAGKIVDLEVLFDASRYRELFQFRG